MMMETLLHGGRMTRSATRSAFGCVGLIVFVGLGCGGCVTTRQGEPAVAFTEADQDRNGVLCRDELNRHLAGQVMERADRNRDGGITCEEWRQADTAPGSDQRFADLDENRDGRVTPVEVSRGLARTGDLDVVFLNMDQDRSGTITPDELERHPAGRLLGIRF